MNRRTSVIIDVLFVLACLSAASSFASYFAGDYHLQLYFAMWGCFCLLMAVLMCVYPGGRS